METGGVKFAEYFKSANNTPNKCGEEEECLVCANDKNKIDCKTSNVCYTLFCTLCKDRKIDRSYIGESSRGAFWRQREHRMQLRSKNKNSVMLKHIRNEHSTEEEDVKFQMQIIGKYKDALNRQIRESIEIRNKKPSELLNSKAEFHGPCVKRKVYDS